MMGIDFKDKKPLKTAPLGKKDLDNIKKTSAAELKKLPSIKKVVSELEAKGITAAKIARKLNDGLDATRPIVADGEVIDNAPDYQTRYRYCELLLKVRGDMQVIPQNPEKGNVNVQVNMVDLGERIQLLGVKVQDKRNR